MYGIFYTYKIFINMNLKSLIREEIDDLDWIKDIEVEKFNKSKISLNSYSV